MLRMDSGRSAVRTMSGTPEWWASSTAGWRFATAVPDVVTRATGIPDSTASPRARNPADRSSMRTLRRSSPARSNSAAASASACERDPGHTTMSRRPRATNSSSRATEKSVAGESVLGWVIVEFGQLLLELADALVGFFVATEVAQEVWVVVGRDHAALPAPAAAVVVGTRSADREPQDDAHERQE